MSEVLFIISAFYISSMVLIEIFKIIINIYISLKLICIMLLKARTSISSATFIDNVQVLVVQSV